MQVVQPDIRQILSDAQRIAVIGCSGRPTRTSHGITRYLLAAGYEIIPVNPNYDEVLGIPCLPSLASIPADVPVDVVNVFRNPRFTEGVVQEVVAFARRTGTRPVVWTQLGVSTPAAAALAQEHDLPYVTNRCIKIEHDRYV